MKRLFDIIVAAGALVALSPVIGIAALGIRLSSPGPFFFGAERVGLAGRKFTMYKLRTMHESGADDGRRITAKGDSRVFPYGALLRRLKIDELPQLLNVLRGDMSVVGPRPEDSDIVENYFTELQLKTLTVRPGLSSPGGIYNYTHGEKLLTGDNPEIEYIEKLMPIKLALEGVYVSHQSFFYDMRIILRTIWVISCQAAGRREYPDPPEMRAAQEIVAQGISRAQNF